MNFSFWLKALSGTPLVSKDEWQKLDFFSKWLLASRASYLSLTVIAVLIVLILTIDYGSFNFLMWALLAVGLVSAQAINNLLNDYTDYIKKVDDAKYFRAQYGTHPLVQGFVGKTEFLLKYVLPVSIIGALCGLLIIFLSPNKEFIWFLFIFGSFLVLFYTWPLKKFALGEISVFLVWGPMMIAGGYYVVSGSLDWVIFLASLPHTFGVTNILLGVHIDKILEDKAKKVMTLPVLIGEKPARYLAIAFFIAPYVLVSLLFFVGFFNYSALIVLLSLPVLFKVLKLFSSPRPKSAKELKQIKMQRAWPVYFVGLGVEFTMVFGISYTLALLVNMFT